MTDSNASIWLLAGLAIVGLLILALPISAHGNGTAPHNETTVGTSQDMSGHTMAWMAEHTATQDTNASDRMGMSGLTNAGHAVHHDDHAHERHHATDEHGDQNGHGDRGHGGMHGQGQGC